MRRCVKLGDGEEENSMKEVCPKVGISAVGNKGAGGRLFQWIVC